MKDVETVVRGIAMVYEFLDVKYSIIDETFRVLFKVQSCVEAEELSNGSVSLSAYSVVTISQIARCVPIFVDQFRNHNAALLFESYIVYLALAVRD